MNSSENNATSAADCSTIPDLLQCSINDAEVMIYYTSHGKMEEMNDLTALKYLANITATVKEKKLRNECVSAQEIGSFYEALAEVSHIIYPVTAKSLQHSKYYFCDNEGMSNGKCDTRTRRFLKWIKRVCGFDPHLTLVGWLSFALLVLTIALSAFYFAGAGFISNIDKHVKRNQELRTSLLKLDTGNKKLSEEQIIESKECFSLKINARLLDKNIEQLRDWNESWFLNIMTFLIKKETTDKPTKLAPYDPCFQSSDSLDAFDERIRIKLRAQMIITVLSSCLLLVLYGFIGACVYILRKATVEISSYTFNKILLPASLIRILLGGISGFLLGYFGNSTDFFKLMADPAGTSQSTGSISTLPPLLLAFVGGYSVDLFYGIINRLLYAITNDEKYLPPKEAGKRKKAIDFKSNLTGDNTEKKVDGST